MDDPHAEVEIKPQLKPRGRVAEEEDPKPSHQLYELQIKLNPQDQPGSLCVGGICKRSLSAHKRKRTSSDSCGHWRQEHTEAGPD